MVNKAWQILISKDDMAVFRQAAASAGLKTSPWARDRLRQAAIDEITRAAQTDPLAWTRGNAPRRHRDGP